jgi:hypothetical protein
MSYSVNVERVGPVGFLATLRVGKQPADRIAEGQTEAGALVALCARLGRCPVANQGTALQAVETFLAERWHAARELEAQRDEYAIASVEWKEGKQR